MQKDVIIIGASLSGATVALKVANAGYKVVIIDKSTFPRSKACGEGLSAWGINILKELGLTESISNLPQAKIDGISVWKSNRIIKVAGNKEGSVVGIERSNLDSVLNDELAKNQNVETYYGINLRKIHYDPDTALYSIRLDNQIIKAPIIIFATGGSSNLSDQVGIKTKKRISKRYGATIRFAGSYLNEARKVHVIVMPKYEIYCTPIGNNRINCSILGDKSLIGKVHDGKFQDFLRHELLTKLKFEVSISDEIYITGPVGRFERTNGINGAFCVGDSSEQLDPIGGMGMTHALLSASILSKELVALWSKKQTLEQTQIHYTKKRKQAVRQLRGFTNLVNLCLRKLPSYHFANAILESPFSALIGNLAHTGIPAQGIRGLLSSTFITLIGTI